MLDLGYSERTHFALLVTSFLAFLHLGNGEIEQTNCKFLQIPNNKASDATMGCDWRQTML